MQKNFIIQAHTNPEQFKRMIDRLDDGKAFFYVHIDKKADIELFKMDKSNVHYIKNRVCCVHADFSQVQATLNCFDAIIRDNRRAYTIFISGQDYPIKSQEKINDYLSRHSQFDHIQIEPVEKNWKTYTHRTESYKINLSAERGDYILLRCFWSLNHAEKKMLLAECLNLPVKPRIAALSKIFFRRKPPIKNQYGGSNWFALTFDTLEKIYSFVKSNNSLVRYYRDTLAADEIFFHTIVKHLSNTDNSIQIKDSITYVNWSRPDCPLPVTFTAEDIDELHAQPEHKLIARKFDAKKCKKILELIDMSI